ncbi:membrane protein of ER body-like protein [Cornus florida]|uniref:membrane protein of ER body-like protein n=1 Tax=Cornus florida TaxID=4283 RepID=UPI0028A1C8DA|nr:membrane protein of ER body-like protein [Cornus florida]
MEVMEQQEEVEVEVEVALQRRRPQHQNNTTKEEGEDKGRLGESVYHDNNRGTETITTGISGIKNATFECSLSELNFTDQGNGKILSNDINRQRENLKGEISYALDAQFKLVGKRTRENEESEEVVIELEFERTVEDMDTHALYCPNCNSSITKVILRRKKRGIFGFGRKNKNPASDPSLILNAAQPDQSGQTICNNGVQGPVPPRDHRIDVVGEPDEKPMKGAEPPTKPQSKIKDTKNDDAKQPKGYFCPDPTEPITGSETKGSKTLDILKSIVYGGLVESIASLSVVSSAAAADATTLNIVALGLANLIGGLFIIGQKLLELKNDQYEELLGGKCLLHAIVALLSFLLFGLIPPVTYAFSFWKSDNKDLKLVAVAAASLLCIVILACGKAYVRKPPKPYTKTLLSYVCNAILVSGVSYAVGYLIKELMEKLGWFDSSVDVTLSIPDTRSGNPAWGSY